MAAQTPFVQLRPPTSAGAEATLVPDEDQVAAIAARGDLVRILGGPGTGKTRVAVASVLDRIAREECAPE